MSAFGGKADIAILLVSSRPDRAVRVYPSGKRVFISQVRVGRATRRVKIGAYGAYTVEQARRRAEEISRIAAEGRDPQRDKLEARSAMSIAELCDEYLQAAHADLVITRFGRPKRPSTLAVDEGRILRHIKPLIVVAPHVGSEHNSDDFLRELNRLADVNRVAVSKVLSAMLTSYVPEYDFEDRLKNLLLKLATYADTRIDALKLTERLVGRLSGMVDFYQEITSIHPMEQP
jgi:hypothetical protein